MKQLSMVTIAVDDLDAATIFYQDGLGFPLAEHSNENISFFELDGSWLALYPREALAQDIGIDDPDRTGFSGITLAHNTDSKEDVDAFIEQAREAGAEVIKEPQEVFWGGYSSYFKDIDGHIWEVAYNPFFSPD